MPEWKGLIAAMGMAVCVGCVGAARAQFERGPEDPPDAPEVPEVMEEPEPAWGPEWPEDELRPGIAGVIRSGRPHPAPGVGGATSLTGLRASGALFGEGTFLVARRGSLHEAASGEWVLVFHRDERGRTDRPVILLPSLTLERMVEAAAERAVAVNVSGQVLTYRRQNYLLATAFSVVEPRGGEEEGREAEDVDAVVGEYLRDLEAQRDRPRILDPVSPRSGRAPVAEGTAITQRWGRVVRSERGQWVFALDTGVEDDPGGDAPMVLMPSALLEQMQRLAGALGEVPAEVSGRVYAYRGRSYLLPTTVRMNPARGLEPRQ